MTLDDLTSLEGNLRLGAEIKVLHESQNNTIAQGYIDNKLLFTITSSGRTLFIVHIFDTAIIISSGFIWQLSSKNMWYSDFIPALKGVLNGNKKSF